MTYDAIRNGLIAKLTIERVTAELLDYSRLCRQADELLLRAIESGAPATDIYELIRGQRLMLAGQLTAIVGALHILSASTRSPQLAEALTRIAEIETTVF